MLYKRRYSDDYLRKKYISTSDKWYDMYLTAEKYNKRLKELAKYYYRFSEHFDDVFNPLQNGGRAGLEIGEPEEYEYYDPVKNEKQGIMRMYMILYVASKRRKICGANDFYEWYQEIREFQMAEDPRYLSGYESLFNKLDYLEYAYPIVISMAKENIKKISRLCRESFWEKLGF